MLFGKHRISILVLICISIISSTLSKREPEIHDPQECYECVGTRESDCAMDQKKIPTPNIRTCNPYSPQFETSIPMCGTQIHFNQSFVRRGCFPGTGEQTCFKSRIGFQCLCREYKCNGREVLKV